MVFVPSPTYSLSHWDKKDLDSLDICGRYADIADVAMAVALRVPNHTKDRLIVCGPMTSGKLSRKINFEIFEATIKKFDCIGTYFVFNQLPLENAIERVYQNNLSLGISNADLVQKIYVPLFKEKVISTAAFIHGWDYSNGPKIEHAAARRYEVNCIPLPYDFHNNNKL